MILASQKQNIPIITIGNIGITVNANAAIATPRTDLGIVIIGSLEIEFLFWFKVRAVCNCIE